MRFKIYGYKLMKVENIIGGRYILIGDTFHFILPTSSNLT